MKRITQLSDVVNWRLCVGCGACAYICPKDRVQLMDFPSEGVRPLLTADDCVSCTLCLDVCPGVTTDFSAKESSRESVPSGVPIYGPDFVAHWGQVLEIWEGHATDPEIRFQGSSGGILTALGAYCIERAGMYGVLHTGQDPADPVRNRTRLSCTRAELLAASGSRYAPASVGNGLRLVENAPAPCAIIGQPSDVAGISKARAMSPGLNRNVAITLSFFCAGSPSTGATQALLQKHHIKPSSVADLRYRGLGWPGHFAPTIRGETKAAIKLTYRESWAFLQAFRPWAVQLWPDGSGELADISCGDPWYFEPDGVNPGSSLVLVRTERGREILRGALEAGYVELTRADISKVEMSQSGLWQKKGSIWGRQLALRLFGIPTTQILGGHLWQCWRPLSINEKLRSTFGTLRRILKRRLYRPANPTTAGAIPVQSAVPAAILLSRH